MNTMKKAKSIKKTFIMFLSLITCVGLWHSCSDDDTDEPVTVILQTVTAVSPTSGMEGTAITVTGTGFGTSGVRVSFNGVSATVNTSSDTSITTSVPEGATTGSIMVTTNTASVNGPTFTVTELPVPTVASYDPMSSESGATVVITGTNFSTTAADNTVWFNGRAATVTAATATTITTTVPSGATSGAITVDVDGRMGTGPEFTVIIGAAAVTSYNIILAEEEAAITIIGENFSTTGANRVIFNGDIEAFITTASSTEIMTTVPTGAVSGPITVEVGGVPAIGPRFSVLRTPEIDGFSRLSALEGVLITISGNHFSEILEENIISFNGMVVAATSATLETLDFIVPTGAVSGSDITVTVNGLTATGEDVITIRQIVTTGSLVVPLESNDDDVEEAEDDGDMDLGSSDLEFGETSGSVLHTSGLRFNTVSIPQGASIASAFIQFRCDNTGAEPVEMTISGENVGNAAPFLEVNFNLTSRTLTTASAIWTVPEWVTESDRLDAQRTVDIGPIIQEIINRADWIAGNTINIVLKNTTVPANTESSGGREAETYDSDDPLEGAELTITLN